MLDELVLCGLARGPFEFWKPWRAGFVWTSQRTFWILKTLKKKWVPDDGETRFFYLLTGWYGALGYRTRRRAYEAPQGRWCLFVMDDEWWMINDEWWMMNDEWWMMNDAWWMMNDEWWMMNDEWWIVNDEWCMVNDEWWMMNDEWWMMNDEWWMMNDEWWMMNDEWRVTTDEWWMMNDE